MGTLCHIIFKCAFKALNSPLTVDHCIDLKIQAKAPDIHIRSPQDVYKRQERKIGRIVYIYEDRAVIQVFEGSESMSLKNTHTKLTGHPMEVALSPDMLGRTFNGIGQPIDDLGPIVSTLKRDRCV